MSQPLTLTLARKAPRTTQIAGSLLVVCLLILPFFALLPATHPLGLSTWMLTLIGKILCYAIVAVALDLVWGYAGMLSLGHGLFFALGGYAMGMYLMRQAAGDGLPAFMSFLSWSELPWFWWGTQHFAWALVLIVLVPGLLALVFGWFAFRSKIKGVYFSIMTQALTYAGMLLFFRNETGFGGNNGFVAASGPGHRVCAGEEQVWPHPDRRARRRKPPDLLRLRSARLQAAGMDALCRAVRSGGGAVRAAGGHYQPR